MAVLDGIKQNRGSVLLAVLLVAWGCDSKPKTLRVAGNVTFDGKPIESGSVVFVPISDDTAQGAGGPITDGAYDIPAASGPVRGVKYRVEISAMRKTGRKIANIMTPDSSMMEETENYIPIIYNSQSILEVTPTPETAGKQDFVLEAAKKGARTATPKR